MFLHPASHPFTLPHPWCEAVVLLLQGSQAMRRSDGTLRSSRWVRWVRSHCGIGKVQKVQIFKNMTWNLNMFFDISQVKLRSYIQLEYKHFGIRRLFLCKVYLLPLFSCIFSELSYSTFKILRRKQRWTSGHETLSCGKDKLHISNGLFSNNRCVSGIYAPICNSRA